MSNKDHIEKIFKDKFENFEQKPANSAWKGIQHKLFVKNFLRYKPFSLNIWNIIAVIAITGSVLFIYNAKNNLILKDQFKNQTANEHTFKTKTKIAEETKIEVPEKLTNKQTIPIEKTRKEAANTSENQISDKENKDDVSVKNMKESYTNKDVKHEEKTTVKLAPHALFSVNTTDACEPVAITFYNTSENCDFYHWDFGNGETSSQKNPTFVFRTAGTYKVTLTVTSGRFSDVMSKKITVFPKPDANFEIRNKSKNLYNGEEIQFSNNSSGFSKCIWNFGDSNTSSYTNPSHIYENTNNYKISLICISDKKCADTAYLNNVFIKDTKYRINFPTAFSPDKSAQSSGYWKNSAYPNSIFYPVINTEISNYRLRVYNKYGTLIFESNNPEIGWNGFYKNSPAQTGVYVWECSGKFENGELFKETGNVTLLYLRNQ